MKTTATLTLLLTALQVAAAEPARVYTGTVIDVEVDRIALDVASGTVYIGFVAEKAALDSLGKVKSGDEVRAVFGSVSGPEGRSINKLLSIRLCEETDRQCSSDYRRQAAQAQQDARESERALEERGRCNVAMQAALAKDPRYVAEGSVPAFSGIPASYNALPEPAKQCGARLLEAHEVAVVEACTAHRCGDNIGGGCWHVAGYSMTSSAI